MRGARSQVSHLSAVVFDRVSKCYRLGMQSGSLRSYLGRVLTSKAEPGDEAAEFWALRDVSFEIKPGETVGLIGSNGAGKTTTLKLMSRVSWPTAGRVTTSGRVAALIELGAGFHPELSGRENVFLNGAILGMSQTEIRRRYAQIVAFAELERFMDTPVKRYSSGMYARLGFAVAAHVDPEILLVDEVLAVGDVNFQRKCFEFIQSFVRSGRTTVFVSHNLYALEQLCNRLVWLERGRVIEAGTTLSVLDAYMDFQDQALRNIEREGQVGDPLRVVEAAIHDAAAGHLDSFPPGADIVVRLVLEAEHPIIRPHLVLAISDATTRQPLILASMLVDGQAPERVEGRQTVYCRFTAPPLQPRTYHVWGEAYSADRSSILLRWQPLAAFSISVTQIHDGSTPGSIRHVRADAPIRAPYTWDLGAGAPGPSLKQ